MKYLLMIMLLLSTSVQAQQIQCPSRYPLEGVTLDQTPQGHQGRGNVSGQQLLNGGGRFEDDPKDGFELQGLYRKVKGGYDMLFDFSGTGQKWFSCAYGQGGEIQWYERVDDHARFCRIQVRNKPGREIAVQVDCSKSADIRR